MGGGFDARVAHPPPNQIWVTPPPDLIVMIYQQQNYSALDTMVKGKIQIHVIIFYI